MLFHVTEPYPDLYAIISLNVAIVLYYNESFKQLESLSLMQIFFFHITLYLNTLQRIKISFENRNEIKPVDP